MNWIVNFVKNEIKEWREWVKAFLIALVLTLIIRTFVFQAFKIPSASMVPTLKVGDKLFVNKFIYRFRDPRRFEIIVFKSPEKPSVDFIKRVIGTPGEVIEIRDGFLLVNGVPQGLPPEIRDNIYYNQGAFGAAGEKILVPANSFYVLGDNSLNSTDSRIWGFVPRKNLVGRAVFRWWPPNRIGRLNRIFAER